MTLLEPVLQNLEYLVRAAGMTLLLAIAALVPATAIGVGLAVVQVVWGRPIRLATDAYLFFMRGVPAFVLVIFVYYMLPQLGLDLSPFWGVTVVLALYYAAFMGEVFRAGVESLPQAQWDGARSLGMSRGLMLRTVVFPQALRLSAPPYVSLCISLVKATSLASVVGLRELTLASVEVVERTIAPFQIFLTAAVIYFVLCSALTLLGRQLERHALAGY